MSKRQKPVNTGRATLADWEAFCAANPDIAYLDAVFSDQMGTVRGKRLPVAEADKIFTQGLQVPVSVYFLDATGVNEDVLGRGFSDGDPDGTMFPLADTLARVPWAEDQAQVLMTMEMPQGGECDIEPRNVLKRVKSRLAASGINAVTAVEFEFYLFDNEADEEGLPQPPINPKTGERETANQVFGLDALEGFSDLLRDIDEFSTCLNVPASAAVAEFAPGQYEINLNHVDDVMKAGDHGILLRYLISAAARQHSFYASFMAKPYLDETGSGCHIHASMLDDKGVNIFDNGDEDGTDLLRYAIGGLRALLPASMAILAPNVNSYRRFGPNMFVPVNGAWGYNNRSVAFRVPMGSTDARRVEHRIAGADVNPYLALAVVLAGIHYGIENQIDPGEPTTDNASGFVDPELPLTMRRALEVFSESEIMRDYLGDTFVNMYAETRRLEYEKFLRIISTREYEWYL
ncbi:MAG: glutamine synthetase [Alphaproteobacteria bacterium]|nr:glutamine synthetase [Alphaproteobacteria bacterium]